MLSAGRADRNLATEGIALTKILFANEKSTDNYPLLRYRPWPHQATPMSTERPGRDAVAAIAAQREQSRTVIPDRLFNRKPRSPQDSRSKIPGRHRPGRPLLSKRIGPDPRLPPVPGRTVRLKGYPATTTRTPPKPVGTTSPRRPCARSTARQPPDLFLQPRAACLR